MHPTSAYSECMEKPGINITHYHIQHFTLVLTMQLLLAGKKTYAPFLKAPLTHVLNLPDTKASKLPEKWAK